MPLESRDRELVVSQMPRVELRGRHPEVPFELVHADAKGFSRINVTLHYGNPFRRWVPSTYEITLIIGRHRIQLETRTARLQ